MSIMNFAVLTMQPILHLFHQIEQKVKRGRMMVLPVVIRHPTIKTRFFVLFLADVEDIIFISMFFLQKFLDL